MSNYPTTIDNDDNLYLVHDSLRVALAEDYSPGDTKITVVPDTAIMSRFPQIGIITLTEQCSDIDQRAVSFFYSSTTASTFNGLQLLPNFIDVAKPKRVTDVTQNVMAQHHNALKDALIAVEKFVGIKGDTARVPLEGTMEARINFLRKLVLQPRAWFNPTKRIGILPLCLTFQDFSTREPNFWNWDFGDGTTSFISRTSPIQAGDVSKCYYTPGIFNVSLTVGNDFGTNTLTFPHVINARVKAPDEATIVFFPTANQIDSGGVLKSKINTIINIEVNTSGAQPLDPITSYTWDLGDDLNHNHADSTTASYSIGGYYNVKLRTDTSLGAYRITVLENTINIVEKFNLWHFIFDPTAVPTAVTKNLYVYEFGLISETYKTVTLSTTIPITRNYNFLNGTGEETQQKREFARNNGFVPKTLVASGDHGVGLLFWAEGATNYTDAQAVKFREYNPFDDIWTTPTLQNGTDNVTRSVGHPPPAFSFY